MKVLFFVVLAVLISSCVRNKNFRLVENSPVTENSPVIENSAIIGKKAFEVKEVIQTSNYTYMKVKENTSERWVAVIRQEANTGDVFYYEGALQMSNFQSKELNRTFDEIFFLSQISKTPIGTSDEGAMPPHSGKVETRENGSIIMSKSKGELTIAQVFGNRTDYGGKEVEIRGIVVKVNESVMDKNWVHIQDGTNYNGSFDLTITTQDLANVGDEVTFKGKIVLDKNFGSGYFYDIIMEEATLLKKNVTRFN
jgi:hypothetical protein